MRFMWFIHSLRCRFHWNVAMKELRAVLDGGGTWSALMSRVCVSECWFIITSALAGALREHNADEEDRVICIIIIINIIMLLNVLMVNTAVVEMGLYNSGDEEQHQSLHLRSHLINGSKMHSGSCRWMFPLGCLLAGL